MGVALLVTVVTACSAGQKAHRATGSSTVAPSPRNASSPAPASSSAQVSDAQPRLEAETMALPSQVGAVVHDADASGGASLGIWANATASGTLTAPAGGHLELRARADYCAGSATAAVSVDGRQVGVMSFGQGGWVTQAVSASWPGGTHRVGVGFTNDEKTSACDRNLRVDVLTVVPGSPAADVEVAPVHEAIPGTAAAFGLSAGGPQAGIPAARAVSKDLDRHLDVLNFYKAWSTGDALPVDHLRQIAAMGTMPEITWEPWDPAKGPHQSAYTPASIASGRYDTYIRSWASAAAAYGKPFLLRFGHEMNGSWYPWAPGSSGADPSTYAAAYRHVHDLFTAAGATNVRWVWSPNIVQGLHSTLPPLWPGDGYVDVIGVDGYNGGTDVPDMGGWRTPEQVFGQTLGELRQRWPDVPVMINETGVAPHGGDPAQWTRDLFTYLRTTDVTGVVWFDLKGQADWRLPAAGQVSTAMTSTLSSW